MKDQTTDQITNEIRQLLTAKLAAFNQGRLSEQGIYIVLEPQVNTLYYTLWRYEPTAVYHPYIYINDLELSALGSVESAMKIVANSFLLLEMREALDLPPDNGDDILLFGKYRGYHLWDIYRIDPRYIQWIAEKFAAQTKNEQRFRELAVSYNKVYLDLQTRKSYKKSASQFVGSVGDKLTGLRLRIIHVRAEDDSYKTKTIDGTVHYYVDQLITAVDEDENRFFLIVKASDRSLNSQSVAAGSHVYTMGESLLLESAKVLKQYVSHNVKYNKLGYVRFPKEG